MANETSRITATVSPAGAEAKAAKSVPTRSAVQPETRAGDAVALENLPAMTDWYNPWQLLDTAKKTAISTIIGENADPRVVSAAEADGECFDYSQEFQSAGDFDGNGADRDGIWIDYVSDVGDGWNPTYSVAYTLAQERLEVGGETLERGEILIFGGDGVYPTAGWDEYDKKLVTPYRLAFNATRERAPVVEGSAPSAEQSDDPEAVQKNGVSAAAAAKTDLHKNPHVFVLPGNHDWYDSLVAFQNLFCTHIFNDRLFAGAWRTRQQRSYFALKLPHKWWLLGVDLQLSHNIDARQLQYFESVVEKMAPGDRVILCVPEPFWVKAIKYDQFDEAKKRFEKKEKSIERLEWLLKKKYPHDPIEIKVYIAGDLHHYRRFESEDGKRIQKITAGGGGAFLHPTHDFDFNSPFAGKKMGETDFSLESQYPAREVSRTLDWKNLYGFMFNSPYFGFLTALLYFLLAWLIRGEMVGAYDWTTPFKITLRRAIDEPLTALTVAAMLLGLIFFTDSNSKKQKYFGGLIHGLFHLGAIFALGWASFFAMLRLLGANTFEYAAIRSAYPTSVSLIWFGCILIICTIGGYVIGSFIMGAYLFVSLHFFKRHDNEAFSALKIEDYKSFLRLHITKDKLTIYPLKIERVARRWQFNKEKGGFYEPAAPLEPELIEDAPVTVNNSH